MPLVWISTAEWLKRGVCAPDPNQECPSRLPINSRGGAHVGDYRGRSPQGEPHSGGYRWRRTTKWPRSRCGRHVSRRPSCWPGPSPLRSARGPSSPPVGSVTCWPNNWSIAGEVVLDVPPTLASRVRVLGTGRSEKNDPNDAYLGRHRRLALPVVFASVERADHTEIMRLLAKRNHDLGPTAGQARSAASTMPAGRALTRTELPRNSTFLMPKSGSSTPSSPGRPSSTCATSSHSSSSMMWRRLDEQIKESHRRIRTAVRASKTSLTTDLFGVGPVLACSVIGYSGDVGRFANRDSLRRLQRGSAPVEHSSGGRVFHRLSLRGHRQASTTPSTWWRSARSVSRHSQGQGLLRSQGRRGQDQARGAALAQAPREQRPLSPARSRRPIGGPGGHSGTTPCLRDRLLHPVQPALRRSHSRTQRNPTPSCPSATGRFVAPEVLEIGVLTQRGFVRGQGTAGY